MKRALPALLALAACNAPPTILPPPFGSPKQTEHLFFPSGFAVAGDPAGAWSLVVANSNSDRSYDAGTFVSIDGRWLTDTANLVGDVPLSHVQGRALIGNYSGPVAIAGARAFTASRDTSLLNAVDVARDGSLSCAGTGGQDCRSGPFALARGRMLGSDLLDHDVLFVGAMSPHVEETANNVLYGSVTVAGVDPVSQAVVGTMPAALGSNVAADPQGIGTMTYDASHRQLLVGGCFQRNNASAAGDPSTSKCFRSNQLRIVSPDAGASSITVSYDLTSYVGGIDLGDLLLVPGSPRVLYATVRSPDALVAYELPDDPAQGDLHVRSAIPTPSFPAGLVRIPRAGAGDLFAVTSQTLQTVQIVDAAAQRVVGRAVGIGDTPYATALLPSPASDPEPIAHLAVGIYLECRIALVDVPLAHPWDAAVRARVGGCP